MKFLPNYSFLNSHLTLNHGGTHPTHQKVTASTVNLNSIHTPTDMVVSPADILLLT